MIAVRINHTKPHAFVRVSEHEIRFSEELYTWLATNAPEWRSEWLWAPGGRAIGPYTVVKVQKPSQALMLKLAWGGQ